MNSICIHGVDKVVKVVDGKYVVNNCDECSKMAEEIGLPAIGEKFDPEKMDNLKDFKVETIEE